MTMLIHWGIFSGVYANVIYVDDDAPPGGNGSSWATAFQYLNDALDLAIDGDEIWVARGVYRPDQGTGRILGDRNARFEIPAGVRVYGSFFGDETSLTEQNPQSRVHKTILSADLNGDDRMRQLDWAESSLPETDDNAFQLVILHTAFNSGTTTLDGFFLRGANSEALTDPANPGSALQVAGNGTALIEQNIFEYHRNGNGGTVALTSGVNASLINCEFRHLRTLTNGAAISAEFALLTVDRCAFMFAEALGGRGGHLWISGSTANISNSLFFAGHATRGGGIALVNTPATLTHNTLRSNEADFGGALYLEGQTVTLNSCLIWGNRDAATGDSSSTRASVRINNSTVTANYSLVQNFALSNGIGNLDGTDPANAPRFEHAYDSRLQQGSPALNQGDPAITTGKDLDGVNRVSSGRSDLGAYETLRNILRVNASVSGGTGDGSSWPNAYSSLQDALAAANDASEIWVAAGIYYPDEGVAQTNNDPSSTFLISGTTRVYGGFNGTETTRVERDPSLYQTILSGDLDQNDAGLNPAGIQLDPEGHTGSNSFHVVTVQGANSTQTRRRAGLDGLVITGGKQEFGGTGFQEEVRGAGLYVFGPFELINCLVIGNNARFGAGVYAGAEELLILDSRIEKNLSTFEGGGTYLLPSSNIQGATLANTALIDNRATVRGSGLFLAEPFTPDGLSSRLQLVHTTIEGSGISTGRSLYLEDAQATVTLANSLFWSADTESDPSQEISHPNGASLRFRHSVAVAHLLDTTTGNINPDQALLLEQTSDPLPGNTSDFIDPSPSHISPLREAGDSRYFPGNYDGRGRPRRFAGYPDIGAYEYRQTIHRVKADAIGAQNGTSWTDAFTQLQDAFDAAMAGDEIWLHAGVHRVPDSDGFLLEKPLAIYGGFSDAMTQRDERSPDFLVSILSADLDANDITQGGITRAVSDQNGNNASRVLHLNVALLRPYFAAPTTLDGLTITAADGAQFGGGLYQTGSVSDLILDNVDFSANAATFGAAIYASGNLTVRNSVFFAGEADDDGGAILAGSTDTLTVIEDCDFIENRAGGNGGALFHSTIGTLTVTDSVFSGNQANGSDSHGGAVNSAAETGTFHNCTFTDNSATKYGAAFYSSGSPGQQTLTQSTFRDNSAEHGGAIYTTNSSLDLSGSTFTGNLSTSLGGAVYVSLNTGKTVQIIDSSFVDNSGSSGGGIYATGDGTFTFQRLRLVGNQASSAGGGLNANFTDGLLIESTEAAGNTASRGAAFALQNSTHTRLVNITAQGNRSDNFGTLLFDGGSSSLENSLIWENQIDTTSLARTDDWESVYANNSPVITYTHSLLEHLNPPGSGNLDGTDSNNTPLFVNPVDPGLAPTVNGDLALLQNSPGIDVGDNGSVAGILDRIRHHRIHNDTVDLGAFEYGSLAFIEGTYAERFPGLDPAADENENGFSNFLDYASGIDPDQPGTPRPLTLSGNLLTAASRAYAEDVNVVFESNTTLSNEGWTEMSEPDDYTLEINTTNGLYIYNVTLQPQVMPADGPTFFRQRFDLQ